MWVLYVLLLVLTETSGVEQKVSRANITFTNEQACEDFFRAARPVMSQKLSETYGVPPHRIEVVDHVCTRQEMV